jgi:glycosyltransferase involved in cell wall biosynthesis
MPNRKTINVLQLIEGLSFGGAETKLLELVAKMDRERFRTVVCSLGMGDRIKNKFDDLNVKFVNLKRRGRIDPKIIWDVAKLIRDEKIDVVMTTLFYADVVGALARTMSPAKAVFSWETISAPEWLLRHRLLTYRFAMHFCDKVVSVSNATADWLVQKRGVPRNKVMVIPYGVDLRLYQVGRNPELKASLDIPAEAPVVGVVARLHPQKGHRYLIDAARDIASAHPSAHFVFVGDGELRPDLEKQVSESDLTPKFHFLGFRDDIKELLKVFDVFVLPSLYEGLPNVILEAMATGLPVVATAVDGTIELIVDNETGFLVPPKNPQELSAKISFLLQDDECRRRFGSRGRERVEQNYSLEKQVASFQNLYESYVKNGSI